MTVYSSILAWKIPWTEEPGRLQSMGLQRVGHNRALMHTRTHFPTQDVEYLLPEKISSYSRKQRIQFLS